MKNVKIFCMLLLAVVAMASCRGPRGPEGPAGQDGYVNVASSTVRVYSNDWVWDNTSWRADIKYEAINADVDESGAVLVYMDYRGTWRQLPMTYYYYDGQYDSYFGSSLEVSTYENGVSIFWTESDCSQLSAPDTHDFKIVVIAAGLYKARTDVDYSNYEAVKAAFQLAD